MIFAQAAVLDGFNWSIFQKAIGDRNWPYVASCAILLLVRAAKLPIFGNFWEKIPKRFRPLVPVLLGILSGIGEAVLAQRSLVPALIYGVFSGLFAVGADQAITKPLAKATPVPDVPVNESEKR
jgi:hypothetical protein